MTTEAQQVWFCELPTYGATHIAMQPANKPCGPRRCILDLNEGPKTRRKVVRFSDPLTTKVVAWKLGTLQRIREGTLAELSRETVGQFLTRTCSGGKGFDPQACVSHCCNKSDSKKSWRSRSPRGRIHKLWPLT